MNKHDEIKSLDIKLLASKRISEELTEISNKLELERGQLSNLELEIDNKKRELEKLVNDKEKEYNSLCSLIEEKKKETLPLMADIEMRLASIRKKEDDLAVIEKRWKKLYEDKGANFKI